MDNQRPFGTQGPPQMPGNAQGFSPLLKSGAQPPFPAPPQQMGPVPAHSPIGFQPASAQPFGFPQQGFRPPASGSMPAEESKNPPPRPPPEPEAPEEKQSVRAYLEGLVAKGQEMIKSSKIPLPPDDPSTSIQKRMEACTGVFGDYERWICPQCTLENTCEFFQCEVCLGENQALKTILEVFGRSPKKHEKGRIDKLLEYISLDQP